MGLIRYVGSQFAKPRGISGKATTFIMNRMNQWQYKAVLKHVYQYYPEGNVLDIGFGNGYLLEKLAPKRYNLYGIDISEDMVHRAKKRLKKYKNVLLKLNRIEDIDFIDDFFDIVYTVNTMYFWTDLNKGLEQIYRILREGGIFINASYTKEWLESSSFTKYDYRKYSREEIEQEAYNVGFSEVNVVEEKKEKSFVIIMRK